MFRLCFNIILSLLFYNELILAYYLGNDYVGPLRTVNDKYVIQRDYLGSAPLYQVNIDQSIGGLSHRFIHGVNKQWTHGGGDRSTQTTEQQKPQITTVSNQTQVPIPVPVIPSDPRCISIRGQYPLLDSCSSYINCWDGRAVVQDCPENLLFSAELGYCNYPHYVNCGNRPMKGRGPGCNGPYHSYRDPNNCNGFYICSNNQYFHFSCPENLQYNVLLGVCDYSQRVNCVQPQTVTSSPPTAQPVTSSPAPSSSSYMIPDLYHGYRIPDGRIYHNVFPFVNHVWNLRTGGVGVAASKEEALEQIKRMMYYSQD